MTSPASPPDTVYDALVLGAGGAGLMCALTAGQRARSVAVIDHAPTPGGKIIVSGGGRCNFTNLDTTAANYVSQNPHFAKSALSRFTPADFVAMVDRHGVAWHEKKLGQLFCDGTARQIVDLLVKECERAGVRLLMRHTIEAVERVEGGFRVLTDRGALSGRALVVATGGLSLPKLNATGVGFDLARQFGIPLVERAPALDGFVFNDLNMNEFEGLSGCAVEVALSTNGVTFREALLFTHTGLSGPAALQVSLHWRPGDPVVVDFAPSLTREALATALMSRRGNRGELKNQVASLMPRRLAERLCELALPETEDVANLSGKEIAAFSERLKRWTFVPARTVGYHKAEVTRGGVDTTALSSKTMEARAVPGLYFIGEVVDVTGWLGGYNYQWAWASGHAAGLAI